MENGTLFIVATPIGNLQDITIRAVQTLFSVGVIYSEQRDKTSVLLTHLKNEYPTLILSEKPPIYSLNEFEEDQKLPEVINTLKDGKSVALVSEAGTPLLSDPGFKVVREAWKRNIPVTPIPGTSSIIAALSASPLPTDKFLFLGFLPKSSGKRIHFLTRTKESILALKKNELNPTVIFFESPHRIIESLKDMKILGEIEIVIAKELTKIHEEFIRGSVDEVLVHPSLKNPKGEFIVLLRFL